METIVLTQHSQIARVLLKICSLFMILHFLLIYNWVSSITAITINKISHNFVSVLEI